MHRNGKTGTMAGCLIGILLWTVCSGVLPAADARIKDIARLQGVRDNPLMGYGLVVGLNGTGDRRQTIFTTQTLANLLQKQGLTIDPTAIKVNNIAAVMVTATLPPFSRTGSPLDVTVSSMGDAQSLQGGTLLMTALKAADGQTYAVAQGPIVIAGFTAGGMSRVQSNHPTAGRIPQGGLIEREPPTVIAGQGTLTYVLSQDDFSTARRMADSINEKFKGGIAQAIDSRTVQVTIPQEQKSGVVSFISEMENLKLMTDARARVVLNEKTGTVVMGRDVKLSAVSIIHGNLTVQVQTELQVSQPGVMSRVGETTVVPSETTTVKESLGKTIQLKEGAEVDDIIRALNTIGATPRDIIAIFQAIKQAGALAADLEII